MACPGELLFSIGRFMHLLQQTPYTRPNGQLCIRDNKTVNRYISALSALYSSAEKDFGWIDENTKQEAAKVEAKTKVEAPKAEAEPKKKEEPKKENPKKKEEKK